MEKQQQANYRDRLLVWRNRLVHEVTSVEDALRDDILSPGGHVASRTHPGDQDVEGLDEQLALAQNEEQLLEQVEAALERIEDGTYGTCEHCGRKITRDRLSAVPYTPWCINCAREQEQPSGGQCVSKCSNSSAASDSSSS